MLVCVISLIQDEDSITYFPFRSIQDEDNITYCPFRSILVDKLETMTSVNQW